MKVLVINNVVESLCDFNAIGRAQTNLIKDLLCQMCDLLEDNSFLKGFSDSFDSVGATVRHETEVLDVPPLLNRLFVKQAQALQSRPTLTRLGLSLPQCNFPLTLTISLS